MVINHACFFLNVIMWEVWALEPAVFEWKSNLMEICQKRFVFWFFRNCILESLGSETNRLCMKIMETRCTKHSFFNVLIYLKTVGSGTSNLWMRIQWKNDTTHAFFSVCNYFRIFQLFPKGVPYVQTDSK